MRALFLMAGATMLLMLVNARAGDQVKQQISFEKGKVGELPPGWKSGVTGKGGTESVWKIAEDKSAPVGTKVLFQTSKNPSQTFNVCLNEEGGKHKDVDITVAVKAVDGKGDQGGGIIWRAKDKDNFYVVRINPIEKNFWLYKNVKGTRASIKKSDVAVGETGKWHIIRVVHTDNKIQCYFDGKLLIDLTDDEYAEAGYVGLWTKADAQTYFADLQIAAKKE